MGFTAGRGHSVAVVVVFLLVAAGSATAEHEREDAGQCTIGECKHGARLMDRTSSQCYCDCTNSWTGRYCQNCNAECMNGSVRTDDCRCKCAGWWTGKYCDQCLLNCESRGQLDTEKCECKIGEVSSEDESDVRSCAVSYGSHIAIETLRFGHDEAMFWSYQNGRVFNRKAKWPDYRTFDKEFYFTVRPLRGHEAKQGHSIGFGDRFCLVAHDSNRLVVAGKRGTYPKGGAEVEGSAVDKFPNFLLLETAVRNCGDAGTVFMFSDMYARDGDEEEGTVYVQNVEMNRGGRRVAIRSAKLQSELNPLPFSKVSRTKPHFPESYTSVTTMADAMHNSDSTQIESLYKCPYPMEHGKDHDGLDACLAQLKLPVKEGQKVNKASPVTFKCRMEHNTLHLEFKYNHETYRNYNCPSVMTSSPVYRHVNHHQYLTPYTACRLSFQRKALPGDGDVKHICQTFQQDTRGELGFTYSQDVEYGQLVVAPSEKSFGLFSLQCGGRGHEWISPASFGHGWGPYYQGYNSPGYIRDKNGIVYFRGLLRGNNQHHGHNVFFNVPQGFRPAKTETFLVLTQGNRPATVEVRPSGNVVLVNHGGNNGHQFWVSIDNLSFQANQAGSLDWTYLHLGHNFRLLGPDRNEAQAARDQSNMVHVRGVLTTHSLIHQTNIIAQLPARSRPKTREIHAANCGYSYCTVTIEPDGRITIDRHQFRHWVSLDGITFAGWTGTDKFRPPREYGDWRETMDQGSKPGYYKDGFGMVHLRGKVYGGQIWHRNHDAGIIFHRIPRTFRPENKELLLASSNGGIARINVEPDGYIRAISGGANSWLSLDGLSYRALHAQIQEDMPSGIPPPPEKCVWIESYSLLGGYMNIVTNSESEMQIGGVATKNTPQDEAEMSFKIVHGLADCGHKKECVSIASGSNEGSYFVAVPDPTDKEDDHPYRIAVLGKDSDSDIVKGNFAERATFVMVKGLVGDTGTVSFESLFLEKHYIRRASGNLLRVDKGHAHPFVDDASFTLEGSSYNLKGCKPPREIDGGRVRDGMYDDDEMFKQSQRHESSTELDEKPVARGHHKRGHNQQGSHGGKLMEEERKLRSYLGKLAEIPATNQSEDFTKRERAIRKGLKQVGKIESELDNEMQKTVAS